MSDSAAKIPRGNGRWADVLYITYDGLLEPLGYSQVLAYLLPLAKGGFRIAILSFEKPSDLAEKARVQELELRLEAYAIRWHRLAYHRRPRVISTLWDVLRGMVVSLWLARRYRPELVHSRSLIAGLVGVGIKLLTRARFIFDSRAFWPEERVELGIFRPNGALFRLSKRVERWMVANADHIVVLTEKARTIWCQQFERLTEGNVSIIPCAVDRSRFAGDSKRGNLVAVDELGSRPVAGNIGAVSPIYLVPELFRFVFHLGKLIPDLKFVYLTRQDRKSLEATALAAGLGKDDILIEKALPEQIPAWLARFQLAVFFPKPCYATQAMCPTKLGEFLAAGVPVVTSAAVGDVASYVDEGVGLVVDDFSDEGLAAAARRARELLPPTDSLRRNCRAAARRHFDLNDGVARYRAIYRSLISRAAPAVPGLSQNSL